MLTSSDRVPLAGGLEVSPLGVGAWAWGDKLFWGYDDNQETQACEAFNTAVDLGVTLFDTAEVYYKRHESCQRNICDGAVYIARCCKQRLERCCIRGCTIAHTVGMCAVHCPLNSTTLPSADGKHQPVHPCNMTLCRYMVPAQTQPAGA